MTQDAIVQKAGTDGYAEVLIERKSACGHDCGKCHGCGGMENQKLLVRVRNPVGAVSGDTVVLESGTQKILGIAVAVYLVPLLLFFIGYLLGDPLGLQYVGSCLLGAVGFVIGIILALVLNRVVQKNKSLEFTITSVKKR